MEIGQTDPALLESLMYLSALQDGIKPENTIQLGEKTYSFNFPEHDRSSSGHSFARFCSNDCIEIWADGSDALKCSDVGAIKSTLTAESSIKERVRIISSLPNVELNAKGVAQFRNATHSSSAVIGLKHQISHIHSSSVQNDPHIDDLTDQLEQSVSFRGWNATKKEFWVNHQCVIFINRPTASNPDFLQAELLDKNGSAILKAISLDQNDIRARLTNSINFPPIRAKLLTIDSQYLDAHQPHQ